MIVSLNAIEISKSKSDEKSTWADGHKTLPDLISAFIAVISNESNSSFVRTAAIQASGDVCGRGILSVQEAHKQGLLVLLDNLLSSSDNDICGASMSALSALSALGGASVVNFVLSNVPQLFRDVISLPVHRHNEKIKFQQLHTIADVLNCPQNQELSDPLLHAFFSPEKLTEFVNIALKCAVDSNQDRACAGIHLLIGLCSHIWGAEACLSTDTFTGSVLKNPKTHITRDVQCILYSKCKKFFPEIAKKFVELDLMTYSKHCLQQR